ncbi:MAG: hypothetical protein R3B09_31780 [Nannocystaceae bacterium]
MTGKRGGPKFIPRPFPGIYDPPGPNPKAVEELREQIRERDAEIQSAPPAPEDEVREGSAPARTRRAPPLPAAREEALEVEDDEPEIEQSPRSSRGARRGGRPAKPDRVQRAIRLTAEVDTKLKRIAADHGIDINAAVSVAIAVYWRRALRSPPEMS